MIKVKEKAKTFSFPVSNIFINNDPRFGDTTNIILEFINPYNGYKCQKIYFLAKEIEKLFEYERIKDTINRLPNENKLILRNINLKGGNPTTFPLLKIPNRGTLIIDIAGLNMILFKSNMPKAIEYQQYIYNKVLPSIWTNGFYFNPIEANNVISNLFSNTIYNYSESNPYLRTLDLSNYEEYKLIINNDNYIVIGNDRLFKMRLYDISFFVYTGYKLSQISDQYSILNPFITAMDIGGEFLVCSIYDKLRSLIRDLLNGYSIDQLENIYYSFNPSNCLFNIPNGPSYIEYQKSKNINNLDLNKLYREAKKNTKDVGMDKDKNVEN